MQNDLHECREIIHKAIVVYEELSDMLYEQASSSTIAATCNGSVLEVKTGSQHSKDIANMQTFRFSLMLMTLARHSGKGLEVKDFVDQTRLTNEHETGGLSGIRFG